MSFFPNALENLIDRFAALPGVGRKSAQRLAFHILSLPEEEALKFADAIVDAKKNIHCCTICQNLTDQETCSICASPKRDQSTICVVAQPRDVLSFERSREYNGVYHVLHGVLSPMNHIGPDDIRIQELIKRVADGGITEWKCNRFDGSGFRIYSGYPPPRRRISYIFFEASTCFWGSSLPKSERKGVSHGIQIENHPARRAW